MKDAFDRILREERLAVVSLAASIVVGIGIRITLAFAADGKSWSDSAIIALMAMHELGGHFYTFYWGQAYMGSIESLGVAPFFAIFGVSDVSLSMGLLPWYVLFAIALYGVTRQAGGPFAGAVSGWLLAFAPPYLQYQQITPRGDYPETLAFGTILLWLMQRVVAGRLSRRAEERHLIAIGLIAGLAFWTNWLVFPYFAVVGVYLLLHDWRLPVRPVALGALAAFFVGSLPFWIFNLRNGFPTFSFLEGMQDPEGRAVSLQYAVTGAIPMLLGVRDLDEKFAFGWLGRALAVAALIGAILLVAGLRRSWLALLRGRVREASPVTALLLLVVAMVTIYSIGLPGRFHVARYLLPLVTSTIALTALAIGWIAGRSQGLALSALSALLVFYGVQIVQFHDGLAATTDRPGLPGPVEKLGNYLVNAGIRYGYADYGDATITTYLMRDRVVLTDYFAARYPLDEVDFHDPALIVREEAPPADSTLRALNASFSVNRIPGYRIYWPIHYDGIERAPLPRRGWRITANVASADASLVLDGDRWTYWSVIWKGTKPVLTIDLGRTETVTGVFFDVGERNNDYFEKLTIESSDDGERFAPVKEAEWEFPVYFDSKGEVSTMPSNTSYVLFPPKTARWLRLVLDRGHSGFNWSVGELAVLGPGRGAEAAAGGEGDRFRLPELPDPDSPGLVERRLRLQAAREPESDEPLVALRHFYESLHEREKLAEIDRLEAQRFRPEVRLDWRFGLNLILLGYDWRALGPRRFEITYYWKGMRAMSKDYAAYVHFEGSDRFQDDYLPGAPRTTRFWAPGEIVKETRVISAPESANGAYRVDIGVWLPGNKWRARLGRWGLWGPRPRTLLDLEIDGDQVTARNAS